MFFLFLTDIRERPAHQYKQEVFRCEICGKRFSRQNFLSRHMRTHKEHHSFKSDDFIDTQDIPMPDRSPFSSTPRHAVLPLRLERNNKVVKNRKMAMHPKVRSKQLSSKGILSKLCRQKQKLERKKPVARQRPLGTEEEDADGSILTVFQCNRCHKQFKSKWCLHQHQVLVHYKSSKHQCMICDKYLPSASGLKAHMLTHMEKGNHECEYCQKKFKTRSMLNVHMKTHTPKIHKYSDHKSASLRSLTGKMKTHQAGEKPL